METGPLKVGKLQPRLCTDMAELARENQHLPCTSFRLSCFFLILLSSWNVRLFWEHLFLQSEALWRRTALGSRAVAALLAAIHLLHTPLKEHIGHAATAHPDPPHTPLPVTSVPSAADCSSLMASQQGLHGAWRGSRSFCNAIHFKCVFISSARRMVPFLFYLSLVFPSLYAEVGT